MSESIVAETIRKHYSEQIQISLGQAVVIGQAIVASGPGADVLVFGCGNDSKLWHELNLNGYTLFLENSANWLREVGGRWPELNLERIRYGGRTVADSLPLDERELAQFPIPEPVKRKQWDVVIIDSPLGYRPTSPGRSLPIYWTSLVVGENTHVFIDDYNRPLERAYADWFFRRRRRWNIEVPRVQKEGQPTKGVMLWSLAVPRTDRSVETKISRALHGVKDLFFSERAQVSVFHSGMRGVVRDALTVPDAIDDRLFYFSHPWLISENGFRSAAEFFRNIAKEYPAYSPEHFCLLINSAQEMEWARRHLDGLVQFIHFNNSALINERRFKVGESTKDFDAVYTARALSFKRHELTSELPSKLFISYRWKGDDGIDIDQYGPSEVLRDLPYREMPKQVARGRVGLILSEEEGACYASLEYLLLGLPVVSTPSRGGRDEFYSPRNSIIVEPTKRAVREGVEEALRKLQEGEFDPSVIRAEAIEKMHGYRDALGDHLGEFLRSRGEQVDARKFLYDCIYKTTKLWQFRNMWKKGLFNQ